MQDHSNIPGGVRGDCALSYDLGHILKAHILEAVTAVKCGTSKQTHHLEPLLEPLSVEPSELDLNIYVEPSCETFEHL